MVGIELVRLFKLFLSTIIRPVNGPLQGPFLFRCEDHTMLVQEATVYLFKILFAGSPASTVLGTLPGAHFLCVLFPLSLTSFSHTLTLYMVIKCLIGGPVQELDNFLWDMFIQIQTAHKLTYSVNLLLNV